MGWRDEELLGRTLSLRWFCAVRLLRDCVGCEWNCLGSGEVLYCCLGSLLHDCAASEAEKRASCSAGLHTSS